MKVVNGYTIENGADLSGANLRRANLFDADLSDANLSGADLSGANLRRANLRRANLFDANLSGANLRRANLRRANLRRANLSDANLSDADLFDANLSGANLRRANLFDANLFDANLSGADLSGADLRRANLFDAQGLNLDATLWLEKNLTKLPNGDFECFKSFSENYDAPSYWAINEGAIITEKVDTDLRNSCSFGINVATKQWVGQNCTKPVWRCIIKREWLDGVIVPYATDGKFRTNKLLLVELVK